MKSFKDYLTESAILTKLTKKQKEFLDSFKKLYGIDLFEFVEEWRTNRKQFTILTDDIPHSDLVKLERFCHDRGVRCEPNGRKALAVWV